MADEAEEEAEPAVELGEGESVEGIPLARVASRLTWGLEHSELKRREGDTVIRTPDGPQSLSDVLAKVDTPYFSTRQEFLDDIRTAIGTGPVPTE